MAKITPKKPAAVKPGQTSAVQTESRQTRGLTVVNHNESRQVRGLITVNHNESRQTR